MNYEETLAYIHQTPRFSRELGNKLLLKLLSYCGNPHEQLPCIHIAGTNGKGSMAIMLSKILIAAGYRVGLFTSPYIERFNERIQINGKQIPDYVLAEIITDLKEKIENYDAPVSEFALDTVAAFCWFHREQIDVVVLETGLGGRLDATNVIPENLVSIIGSIGLEHTQYLGDTYEKIAAEKCGIIKEKCPVISYPIQKDTVKTVIQQVAKKKNAPLHITPMPKQGNSGVILNGREYQLGLQGEFQIYNAATVYQAIEVLRSQGYKISESAVKSGYLSAHNPARFERFDSKIILDGAHNPSAIISLKKSLEMFKKNIWFCIAMMEDKDIDACVSLLQDCAKGIVITEIPIARCCPGERLKEICKSHGIEEVYIEKQPYNAIEKALSLAGKEELICICGSLYLAGEVRPYLVHKFQNPKS